MQVTVKNLPKSQVQLNVVVPNNNVKSTYNAVVDQIVEETELDGFRKGKAPKDKVLAKTDKGKLYGEVVNQLLEKYYPQAVKEKLIQPISNPKVEIKEFDIEKDFEFDATLATKPEVNIGDYKKALKEAYDNKVKEAKAQNAEKLKKGEEISSEQHIHLSQAEIVEAILNVSNVEIADILVEQETERMLSRLVDQLGQIGLTLEKYLEAQTKTAEQLRKEYEDAAETTIKGEFVLGTMVVKENVNVSEEDLVEALKASGVENAVERLKEPTEKWYIKSILEKNNLLTKLAQEVEGHSHDE